MIITQAGLQENLNSSLSFVQAALTFCMPWGPKLACRKVMLPKMILNDDF